MCHKVPFTRVLILIICSIEVVKQQLDSENLGIITKVAFLDEFYPKTEQTFIPEKFKVYHYNGLARSNKDNQVLCSFRERV